MYRILVADDEPIERMVIGKTIEKYFPGQVEIVLAENGREAVELAEEHNSQILLLDIEMPGVNGLEAAARIRQRDRQCCIIFVTAFDEFSYAKQAISVRALEYLLKPTRDEELIAVLEEAFHQVDARINAPEGNQLVGEEEMSDSTVIPEEDLGDTGSERTKLRAVARGVSGFIEENYTRDISLQDVARAMNYSDPYMSRLFKQCFDKSFIVYLTEFRVEKAKQILEKTNANIREVSALVGFRDSNYFTRVFKRLVGCTPSEYRH